MAGQVFAGLGPDGGGYQPKKSVQPPLQPNATRSLMAKAVTATPRSCGR